MVNDYNQLQILKEQYNATFIDRDEAESIENNYREKYNDFLEIKDHGYTVTSKTNPKIELSKGCASCKSGSWLCLFVGYDCNANCPFCPQAELNKNLLDGKSQTSYGNIHEFKYLVSTIGEKLKGISYSGGEPLLYLDKILDIAEYVKENRPDVYQWMYTNGIILNEENASKLKAVGISEIRLNLTATNFNEDIINKIPMAKNILGKVTVEIPAIPEIRALTKNNLLERLVKSGVEQLNIAELSILNAKTADNYCKNAKIACHFQRGSSLCLMESTNIFYEIIDYVKEHNINILVNHCDHNAKMIQVISKETNNLPKT